MYEPNEIIGTMKENNDLQEELEKIQYCPSLNESQHATLKDKFSNIFAHDPKKPRSTELM